MSYLTERLLNAQYHNHEEDCCCGECGCENEHDHEEIVEKSLSESEIEEIINEKYSEKDEKTKEFIRKGLRKFGDRFDYSKTEYSGSNSTVIILCPQHGEFSQVAISHYRPDHGNNPCPYCSKLRKTTIDFIVEAKKIHGDKYDYSETVYAGTKNKVKIFCNKCKKYFYQIASEHLRGRGCPDCGRKLVGEKLTKKFKDFVEQANVIHNKKYDYSESEQTYTNTYSKITIICPIHGKFVQRVSEHLHGAGCPICRNSSIGDRYRFSLSEFISRSRKIHGNKYDYSKVNYINLNTPVTIICPIHGEFSQTPRSHLGGIGCPLCPQSNLSNGEKIIQDYLTKHNICILNRNERLYGIVDTNIKKFIYPDFRFLLNGQMIWIEYNGIQHYEYIPYFCNNDISHFLSQVSRDCSIRKYCTENRIKLIEVPYIFCTYQEISDFLDKVLFKEIDPHTLVDYDSLYVFDDNST